MAFIKENAPGDFNARHTRMTRFGKNLWKRQRKNAYKRLRESSFFHLILKSEIRILLENKEVKSEKLLWWVSSAGRKIIDIIFAERPLIIEKNK